MSLQTRVTRLFLSCLFFLAAPGARADDDFDAVSAEQLLAAHSPVHAALVIDELEKAQAAAKDLEMLAATWLGENPGHAMKASVEKVRAGARSLGMAEDLDDARVAFVKISAGAIGLIRADAKLKAKWQLFFCPMVAKDQGYWVQPRGQELLNPFMGTSMPGCGGKKPW